MISPSGQTGWADVLSLRVATALKTDEAPSACISSILNKANVEYHNFCSLPSKTECLCAGPRARVRGVRVLLALVW